MIVLTVIASPRPSLRGTKQSFVPLFLGIGHIGHKWFRDCFVPCIDATNNAVIASPRPSLRGTKQSLVSAYWGIVGTNGLEIASCLAMTRLITPSLRAHDRHCDVRSDIAVM